jgi:hypothetical protein
MKKLIVLPILILAFISSGISQQSPEEDKEAVKKVIQMAYVEGLQNEGNTEKIDAGFHPGFELLGIAKGDQIWKLPIYTWRERAVADVKSGKKPKPEDQKVTVNFLSVDVTGTAAVVKLEFLVGGVKKYVDYLSLYKFESGWKIVNKIYYQIPEDKPSDKI